MGSCKIANSITLTMVYVISEDGRTIEYKAPIPTDTLI